MELHPIVVHYPIAFLSLYAIFELIRFEKVLNKPYWFFVKAILVIMGEFGAIVAALTGPSVQGNRLIFMHELFAKITILIFGIIAIAYILEWFRPSKFSLFIMRPYILVSLALVGFGAITITGGLGGAAVYGTNFDPFMSPIFKLLGVY